MTWWCANIGAAVAPLCSWRKWREVEFLTPSPDVKPDDLRTGRGVNQVSQTDVDRLDPA